MGVPNQTSNGFTIIEVVLFLAISAFMIFIALNGLQGRTDRVRFNSSVRALEATVQQQKSQISEGVIDAETVGNCETSPCIFSGKVFEFTANESDYKIHTLAGNLMFNDAGTERVADTLLESKPKVVSTVEGSLEWQLEFTGAKQMNLKSSSAIGLPSSAKKLFGYFRLPNSTELFPIAFAVNGEGQAVIDRLNNPNEYSDNPNIINFSSYGTEFGAELCFTGINGDNASMKLGLGAAKEVVVVDQLVGLPCL